VDTKVVDHAASTFALATEQGRSPADNQTAGVSRVLSIWMSRRAAITSVADLAQFQFAFRALSARRTWCISDFSARHILG